MRTNREQFERDFGDLIETGDLYIEHEELEYSIFILQDGTPINSLFELGYRVTDHQVVLQVEQYTMNNMITIEPERHAIMVDTTQLTDEQLETMKGYSIIWDNIIFYDIENDCITEQVNELLEKGFDLATTLAIVRDVEYLD